MTFATVLFFFLFFPFLHRIAIFPMYIYLLCNLRIIRFEDGNFSPFREIESRESAIFLPLTINDNRSKVKKEFESRKEYLSTTRSPLPPKKRIHPSFLFSPTTPPFSNACRSKSPAPDTAEYTGSPDTSKQQTNAYASWHKSHRHLSLSVS